MSIDTSTEAVEARCQHLDHVAHDRQSADAALMRALAAERDTAENRAYDLAYVICGGEDAPGLLESISTHDLADMITRERAAARDQWEAAHNAGREAGRKAALEEAAELSEHYASHYPQGSDGRNTFTILADTLRKRKDTPND